MKKDLFDLFRENEHLLNERPSEQTWRRLEQRLDAHKRRGRMSAFRPLSMAAGITLLVTLVTLLSLSIHRKQHPDLLSAAPRQLELLPSSDTDAIAIQVMEYTRSVHDRSSKPIEEGTPAKRLVPVEQ